MGTKTLPASSTDHSLESASSLGIIDSEIDRQEQDYLQQLQRGYAYWKQRHASRQALQKLWETNFHQKLQNGEFPLTRDCRESLDQVVSDSSKVAVLKDAIGQTVAGIADGSLDVVEAFGECLAYNYTDFCFSSKLTASAVGTTSWEVGLCIPKHCTENDLMEILREAGELDVMSSLVCTDSKHSSFSVGAISMIVLTILIAALVLVGTVADALSNQSCSESSDLNKQDLTEQALPMATHSRISLVSLMTAFSLFRTLPVALAASPDSISCLNGLRVVSMIGIILGQAYTFVAQFSSVNNVVLSPTVASNYSFQAVGNAYFSVDSFFFLSGVLVAYLTLKEMKKKDGRFPFLHYYIHRYLRITPTYAFILFFASSLGIHLAVGPYMSLSDPLGPACSKYWWTNLLYINNLYPWKLGDECLGWGWYLANDMQFYVIAPLMLISAYFFLPASAVIAGALVLSGFTIDGVLTGAFDFRVSNSSDGYQIFSPSSELIDQVYIKPWSCIAPYTVGLGLGYMLYKQLNFNCSRVVNALLYGLLWAVALLSIFWLFHCRWQYSLSQTEYFVFVTFGRFFWAASLAIIVFACHNGYGWLVNSFLSMKLWIPLARMTFNAYLVHPLVMFGTFWYFQIPIHYTDLSLACYVILFVTLSYIAGGVLGVSLQLPLQNLQNLLLHQPAVQRTMQSINLHQVHTETKHVSVLI